MRKTETVVFLPSSGSALSLTSACYWRVKWRGAISLQFLFLFFGPPLLPLLWRLHVFFSPITCPLSFAVHQISIFFILLPSCLYK
uniref:Uncharacterized protein n=1 Tax=Oryza brachyantha TaxID=4533 RepID=J3NAY4_ORYBR